MDTILSSSRSVLELSWKNPREWDSPILYCTFPESLGSPLEAVLMGNITKRGNEGRAADGPRALEGGTVATLHVQLCEAIMRQDCTALRALLRSHPVNQPMTVPASSTGYSLANSRQFLSQVLASPARSLSALSMPRARQCAPSRVLPSVSRGGARPAGRAFMSSSQMCQGYICALESLLPFLHILFSLSEFLYNEQCLYNLSHPLP